VKRRLARTEQLHTVGVALSVEENLRFFGRLFGHASEERRRRIDSLTAATGLSSFREGPAKRRSGGMKQKPAL